MRKTTSGYLSFIILLTVLSLLSSLFMATSVAVATETNVVTINDYDETAHECPGSIGFKIEADWIEEGESLYELKDDEGNLLFSVTLDVVFDDGEPFTFTYSGLDAGFTLVQVKGGDDVAVYPDYPMTPNGKNRAAISHINFCGTTTTTEPDPISINLLKVDDEEVPNTLDGVSFNLTDDNGYDENATTANGGQAAFANLTAGSYTLTETANTNESCDTAGPWTVTVADNQGTLSASMTDANQALVAMSEGKFVIVNDCEEEEETTKIRLIKVDQDDNALEGVGFMLIGDDGYDRNDTTDENGFAEFTDLVEGTYALTEVFNRDESCTNDGPWTVVVSAEEENGQIQTLIVEESSLTVTIYDANENELELVDGRFKIVNDCEEPEEDTVDLDLTKTTDADTDPRETLAGVMFNLSDGELGGYNTESTTDEDGRARFEDLTIGEYTLTEISNPHAGCVTAGPWTVTVEGAGEIQENQLTITVKDNEGNELELQQDGSFRIVNVCEEPEEPTREIDLIKVNQDDETLGGVTFTLEGEGIDLEATTAADGVVTFTGLGEGTYTLTETANSNEGCETAGPWTVVIFANAEIETILEVAITDDDSNVLTANADGSFNIVNECEEPKEPKTPQKPTPPQEPGIPNTAMAVDDSRAPVGLLGFVLLLSAGVLVLNKRKELFAAGA